MEYKTLGRSGFTVSALGLGAGGPSRIGQSQNASIDDSVGVVREAIDLGITFIDTAEGYGTEEIVGNAIRERSSREIVLSSKLSPREGDEIKNPESIERALDSSLRRLGLERIEIYHAHGVRPEHYTAVRDNVYPVFERMKEKGKIGSIGITEMFGADNGHKMLDRALSDDLWDVVMIGFNMLNFSGRKIIRRAVEQRVGVLDMFAVRRTFREIKELGTHLDQLISNGLLDRGEIERENPFKTALESGECESLADMAYRFCLHEPGMGVVLSGTGSVDHLRQNRTSADRSDLSAGIRTRIESLFGSIDSVSGN